MSTMKTDVERAIEIDLVIIACEFKGNAVIGSAVHSPEISITTSNRVNVPSDMESADTMSIAAGLVKLLDAT